MKINCNIIRDLLPLYNDNITSKESKELVEEHLKGCDNCKNYLKEMQEEMNENTSLDEKTVINNFFKQIKKKRLIAIIFTIILTIIIVSKATDILNKDNCFIKEYTNGLITVEEKEDKTLVTTINAKNYDYSFCNVILEQNVDGSIDVYITLFQSIMDRLKPTKESKTIAILPKCVENYIDKNTEYNWLWENNEGKFILKPLNDTKIANIYYLETMQKYNAISKSHENVDPFFEMIKIWENK